MLFLGDVWYYSQPSQNQLRFFISISKTQCFVNMKSMFKENLAIVESRIMENSLGKKCISRKKLHTYMKMIATLIININKWVLIYVPSKSIFPLRESKIYCVLKNSIKKSNASGIYSSYMRGVGVRGSEWGGGCREGGREGRRFRDFITKSMRFQISIAKPNAP